MSSLDVLQSAIAAHKEGRLPEAEAAYEGILREHPGEANALNFLGMLRFHQGRADDAVELLRRSVASNPDNPNALINLGNLLMSRNEHEEGRAAFTKATEIAPRLSLAWYNLGVCLKAMKKPVEACDAYRQAIDIDPHYDFALDSLANLYLRLGRKKEAHEIYEKWLASQPDNPIAKHMGAAVSGTSAPSRAADDYVRVVFDQFADSFDQSLTELGYRAPQLLTDALTERFGASKQFAILDAGCGTGWCGPLLRPMARKLVGVDLSPGMVGKARPRQVYDELFVDELCTFMRSEPSAFDVVLSADTLCYFGALGEALAAANVCLREEGVIAFTLEALVDGPPGAAFHLQPHGRYSHAEWYVRDALAAAGFGDVRIRAETLRSEGGKPVPGHVVTAIRGKGVPL